MKYKFGIKIMSYNSSIAVGNPLHGKGGSDAVGRNCFLDLFLNDLLIFISKFNIDITFFFELYMWSLPFLLSVAYFFVSRLSYKKFFAYVYFNLLILFIFLFSFRAWFLDLDFFVPYYQMLFRFNFGFFEITFNNFISKDNLFFVLFTPVLILCCSIYEFFLEKNGSYERIIILAWLNPVIMHIFLSFDFFCFFTFLEISTILMYYLIFTGSRKRSSFSSYVYIFLSMLAAAFILLSIIILGIREGTTSLFDLFGFTDFLGGKTGFYTAFSEFDNYLLSTSSIVSRNFFEYKLEFILLFLGLGIKVPLFFFHFWLPEVHGEASTSGSVVLAGLFLKFPVFGFLRFAYFFYKDFFIDFVYFSVPFFLIGSVFIGLIVYRLNDLKRVIAYSSVVHMGIALSVFFIADERSNKAFLLYMVAHSLVTPALFFVVGAVYDILGSRNVFHLQSVFSYKLVSYFLMFCFLLNISFPISLGFVGEFNILLILFGFNVYYGLLSILSIFLLAISFYFILLKLFNSNVSYHNFYSQNQMHPDFEKSISDSMEKPALSKRLRVILMHTAFPLLLLSFFIYLNLPIFLNCLGSIPISS